jgi:hypothetical protein
MLIHNISRPDLKAPNINQGRERGGRQIISRGVRSNEEEADMVSYKYSQFSRLLRINILYIRVFQTCRFIQ